VILNLAASLSSIGLALQSLWFGSDAITGWLAVLLLMALLVEPCILAVCSASILDSFERRERGGRLGGLIRTVSTGR
jgi:hypothetical protein